MGVVLCLVRDKCCQIEIVCVCARAHVCVHAPKSILICFVSDSSTRSKLQQKRRLHSFAQDHVLREQVYWRKRLSGEGADLVDCESVHMGNDANLEECKIFNRGAQLRECQNVSGVEDGWWQPLEDGSYRYELVCDVYMLVMSIEFVL